MTRLARVRRARAHDLEWTSAAGQVLSVRYTPIVHGGLVLTYADITARKHAEEDASPRATR